MIKYIKIILIGCPLLIGIPQALSQGFVFDSGSDESFGAINITETTTIALPDDGIIHATTVTVADGVTLFFDKNEFNTPVFLLATGDISIAGTINVNGRAGSNVLGGVGGPGGFDGGTPGSSGVSPGDGHGPGGGLSGNNDTSGLGAGSGSYSSQSPSGSSGGEGAIYGSALLIPMIGGSGGGGISGTPGIGGGGGGGALLIASNTQVELTSTGIVHANGGLRSGNTINGGSGGAVRLVAPKVFGSGVINAQSRNSNSALGGQTYGGYGRVRVDSIDRTDLSITFNPAGHTSVGTNMVVFPTPAPRLDITEVAGTAVTLDTSDGVFVVLPFNADPNRTVTVRAENFNKVVNFAVVLQPVNGSRIVVEDSIDNTTTNPASKVVNVVFPLNTQTKVFVWTIPDP